MDGIEDRFLAAQSGPARVDLAATRRVLVRLQRTLAPEPGSVFRLLARPPAWLQPRDVQELRESTEEFSVVLGDMAGLIERIRLRRVLAAACSTHGARAGLVTLARPGRPGLHRGDRWQELRESTEEFSVVLGDMAGLIERIRLRRKRSRRACRSRTTARCSR